MLPPCRGIPASASSASTYSVHNHLLHTEDAREMVLTDFRLSQRTSIIIIIKLTPAVADVNVFLVGKRKI